MSGGGAVRGDDEDDEDGGVGEPASAMFDLGLYNWLTLGVSNRDPHSVCVCSPLDAEALTPAFLLRLLTFQLFCFAFVLHGGGASSEAQKKKKKKKRGEVVLVGVMAMAGVQLENFFSKCTPTTPPSSPPSNPFRSLSAPSPSLHPNPHCTQHLLRG